jgi:hypothetical protein
MTQRHEGEEVKAKNMKRMLTSIGYEEQTLKKMFELSRLFSKAICGRRLSGISVLKPLSSGSLEEIHNEKRKKNKSLAGENISRYWRNSRGSGLIVVRRNNRIAGCAPLICGAGAARTEAESAETAWRRQAMKRRRKSSTCTTKKNGGVAGSYETEERRKRTKSKKKKAAEGYEGRRLI